MAFKIKSYQQENKISSMNMRNGAMTVEPINDAFWSSSPTHDGCIDESKIKPMSIKDRIRAMNLESAPTTTPKSATLSSYKIPLSPSKSVASAPCVDCAQSLPSQLRTSSATSDFSVDYHAPQGSYSSIDQIVNITRYADADDKDEHQPSSGTALWNKRYAVASLSTDARDDGSSVIHETSSTSSTNVDSHSLRTVLKPAESHVEDCILSAPPSAVQENCRPSLPSLQQPNPKSDINTVLSATNKVALLWKLKDAQATSTSPTASSTSTFEISKLKTRTEKQDDNFEENKDLKRREGHQSQVSASTHASSPLATSTVSAPHLTLPANAQADASAVGFWRRRQTVLNVGDNTNRNEGSIVSVQTPNSSPTFHNCGNDHAKDCTKSRTHSCLSFNSEANNEKTHGISMECALSNLKGNDQHLVDLNETSSKLVPNADEITLASTTQTSCSDAAHHHSTQLIPDNKAAIFNLKPLRRNMQMVEIEEPDEKKLLTRSNLRCGKVTAESIKDIESSVLRKMISYESAASARSDTDAPSLKPVSVDKAKTFPSSSSTFEIPPLRPVRTNHTAPLSPQASLSLVCTHVVSNTSVTLSAKTPATFAIPSLKPVARRIGGPKNLNLHAVQVESASTETFVLNAPLVHQQQNIQTSTKLPSPSYPAVQTGTSMSSLNKVQISACSMTGGRNGSIASSSLPPHQPYTQSSKSLLEVNGSQDNKCLEKSKSSTHSIHATCTLGFKPALVDAHITPLSATAEELKSEAPKGGEEAEIRSACNQPSQWSRYTRQHEKHNHKHEQLDAPGESSQDSSHNSVYEKKSSTMHVSQNSSRLCNRPVVTSSPVLRSKQDSKKIVSSACTAPTMDLPEDEVVASDRLVTIRKKKNTAGLQMIKGSEKQKQPYDRATGSDKCDKQTLIIQGESKKSETDAGTTCEEAYVHKASSASSVSVPTACTLKASPEFNSQNQNKSQTRKQCHSYESNKATSQGKTASREDEKWAKGKSPKSSSIDSLSNEMVTEFISGGATKQDTQQTKQAVFINEGLSDVLENLTISNTETAPQVERSDETSTVSTAKINNYSQKRKGQTLRLPLPGREELNSNVSFQDWKSNEVVAINSSEMRSEIFKKMINRRRKLCAQKETAVQCEVEEPSRHSAPAMQSSYDVDSRYSPEKIKLPLPSSPTTSIGRDCLDRSDREKHFKDPVALLSTSDDDHGNNIPAASVVLPVSPPPIIRSTHREYVDYMTDQVANQAHIEVEADRKMNVASPSFESGVYYRSLQHRITSENLGYSQSNASLQSGGKPQSDAGFLNDEDKLKPKDVFRRTDQDTTMSVDLSNVKGNALLGNTEVLIAKPRAGTPERTFHPGQTNQTTPKTANRHSSLKNATQRESAESRVDRAALEQFMCSPVFEPVIIPSARTPEKKVFDRKDDVDNQSASLDKQKPPCATSSYGVIPPISRDGEMSGGAYSLPRQSCNCVRAPFGKCESPLCKKTSDRRLIGDVAPYTQQTPVISNKKLCRKAGTIDSRLDGLAVSGNDTSRDEQRRNLTRTTELPAGTRLHNHHSPGVSSEVLASSTRSSNPSTSERRSLLSSRATKVLQRRRKKNGAMSTVSVVQDMDLDMFRSPDILENASDIKKSSYTTSNKPLPKPDTWVSQKSLAPTDWPSNDILGVARNRLRNVQIMRGFNQFDSLSSSVDTSHDEFEDENECVGFEPKTQIDSSLESIQEPSPPLLMDGDFTFATEHESDCKPLTEVFIFDSPNLQYQSLTHHLNVKSSSSSLSVNEISFDNASGAHLSQHHVNGEAEGLGSDLMMWISNTYKNLADKLDGGSPGANGFVKINVAETGLLACGEDDISNTDSPVRISQSNDKGNVAPEELVAIEVEYLEDDFSEEESFLESSVASIDEEDLATPYNFPPHSKDVYCSKQGEKRGQIE